MLNIDITEQDYLEMDEEQKVDARHIEWIITESKMPDKAKEMYEKDLLNIMLDAKESV